MQVAERRAEARRGERLEARVSRATKALFQKADLIADCRLRNGELFGGASEIHVPRRRFEGPEAGDRRQGLGHKRRLSRDPESSQSAGFWAPERGVGSCSCRRHVSHFADSSQSDGTCPCGPKDQRGGAESEADSVGTRSCLTKTDTDLYDPRRRRRVVSRPRPYEDR